MICIERKSRKHIGIENKNKEKNRSFIHNASLNSRIYSPVAFKNYKLKPCVSKVAELPQSLSWEVIYFYSWQAYFY